jgi:hypothetical protein
MSQTEVLKTTDVSAAKRFIAEQTKGKKARFTIGVHLGDTWETVYTHIPIPSKKAMNELIDEIDSDARPNTHWFNHLDAEERRETHDFIHDNNIRKIIVEYALRVSSGYGFASAKKERVSVHLSISTKRNQLWNTMVDGWISQRKVIEEREAKEAADAGNDEEEE